VPTYENILSHAVLRNKDHVTVIASLMLNHINILHAGPAMDDTWLLVLVASCAGVLLLGALLALFVLKCRVYVSYSSLFIISLGGHHNLIYFR
jgi:hypothetical protein